MARLADVMPHRSVLGLPCIAMLVMSLFMSTPVLAAHVYRFAVPGVINLSHPAATSATAVTRDVPRALLDASSADALMRRTDCGADGPWQLAPLAVDERHARAVERHLLSRASGRVQRAGKRLSLTPARGKPITFDDWSERTTRWRDGDSEFFIYAGTLAESHYHRVEVRYGHDSPGAFLVHPATGRTAYAHNGSAVVAAAPGGARIAVFETLNAPYPLVIAALDAPGPAVEVRCRVDTGTMRVTGAFCGWQDDGAVAVRFTTASGLPNATPIVVARLARTDGRWHLFVADHAAAAVQVRCHESTR